MSKSTKDPLAWIDENNAKHAAEVAGKNPPAPSRQNIADVPVLKSENEFGWSFNDKLQRAFEIIGIWFAWLIVWGIMSGDPDTTTNKLYSSRVESIPFWLCMVCILLSIISTRPNQR